jgi:glutathione S-transferase
MEHAVESLPTRYVQIGMRSFFFSGVFFTLSCTLKKGIPDTELAIVSPTELGGFKSAEYLAINPQGKVPALKSQVTGMNIAESDSVCRYLLSEYAAYGPSFQPDNHLSNMLSRFNDVYLNSIQMCLYKPGPPFGSYGTRKDALKEFSKQLYVIAEMMDPSGSYLCGTDVSLADATIFPTIVFADFMFPKFDHGIEQAIPEKIEAWFQRTRDTDSSFRRVYDEVRRGALDSCGHVTHHMGESVGMASAIISLILISFVA